MNKRWKESKKSQKNSPILFEEEENATSPSVKSSATPQSHKICSGHSTPIRNKTKTDSSDSPDLNYNESPIEPLTQHPPNEVGWDYQRPLSKDEQDGKTFTSTDIIHTPKRNVLISSKKRNSNSPLLYKPLKKKLIQEDQQEHMAGFLAELKAIEIKAKLVEAKNIDDQESQLVVEMDSQDDSDIKLQVSANTDESPGQSKIGPLINKNYDALLDDSIEDIMVLCSQEVEAKEFGMKKVPPCIVDKANPDATSETYTNKSKENVQPLNNNDRVFSDTSSKNSSTTKADSNSLEIPDDSFDEFFTEIDDKDLCKNTEIVINCVSKSVTSHTKTTTAKSSTVQNKFFQNKKPINAVQPKGINSTTSIYIPQSQNSNVSTQTKVINTKANFGYLNREYMKQNESQTQSSYNSSESINKNSSSRLFKAKSFSDSNFLHQSTSSNNLGRSHSNLNMNTQRLQNGNSAKQNSESSYYNSNSSSSNKSWRRVNSSSSIGNDKSSLSNGGTSHFTPAEIERKRQEALMKRAAKQKCNNVPQNRPIQNFVKR